MRRILDVGFKDVSADRLVYAFGLVARPALASLCLPVGDGRLELRVLGASHQALLVGDADVVVSESVACDEGEGWLPPSLSHAIGERSYSFRSEIERHGRASLARSSARIESELTEDPAGIVAVFPGAPHAITGMAATVDASGPAWRTWHVYPETGEIVLTSSELG